MKVQLRFGVFLVLVATLFAQEAPAREYSDALVLVFGTVRIETSPDKRPETIEGAVIKFQSATLPWITAKTDKNGRYEIALPADKYYVYATASDECWMCAEYYDDDFVVTNKRRVRLDALLRFMGEGHVQKELLFGIGGI